MNRRSFLCVVTSTLALASCTGMKYNTGPGWIRSIHARGNLTDIVFEHDDGRLETLRILTHRDIPVWVGMHCEIVVNRPKGDWEWDTFVSVKRLGPDANCGGVKK